MLLDPGDTVLMEDHGYFGVPGVFIRAGVCRLKTALAEAQGVKIR